MKNISPAAVERVEWPEPARSLFLSPGVFTVDVVQVCALQGENTQTLEDRRDRGAPLRFGRRGGMVPAEQRL